MRWVMSMAWPVSTMSNAKSCEHMRGKLSRAAWLARAFVVFEYMDGRSNNGGESEARAAMILAGVAAPDFKLR